jgi:hypothetical protein
MILAGLAVLTIIGTQIITTRLNSARIVELTNEMKKANGRVRQHSAAISKIQGICAATHGIEYDDLEDNDG